MGRPPRIDRRHGSGDRRDVRRKIQGRNLTVAVDTNIIVRVLVDDDPEQAATARSVLARGFLLTASVLLETEWVLRSTYKWPRARIADALTSIADLPSLDDAPARTGWAIERFAAGADFADVLHLATASSATSFATFDRRLARQAGSDAPITIETLR